MSPLVSQLALLTLVGGCLGLGFWIESRRKHRLEDDRARQQIGAAVELKRADEEGEAIPPAGDFVDLAADYGHLWPERCRAIVGGNRCTHDAHRGELCAIHWKMDTQGYPTRTGEAV